MFDQRSLDAAWDLLRGWNTDGHCRAVAAETGHAEGDRHSVQFGQLGPDDKTVVDEDSIFLIASPTKPVVATAAMMLVERGQLQLDHLVQRYLPGFARGEKAKIRLFHLLTHTSGLPDMVRDNVALRQKQAPLSEFMKCVYDEPLLATPGTKVHYQSMGLLTLASVMETVTGQSLPEFLREEIFLPLGMTRTSLGVAPDWQTGPEQRAMAWSQVESIEGSAEWGWNSDYWRNLAAPWGGLLSSAKDWGIFCRHLLQIHGGERGLLHPATLRVMTTNRLPELGRLTEWAVRSTPWGLGWQMNWPGHPRGFGSVLPRESYGHWGATGTLIWIDPIHGSYGVVLTTEPIQPENRRQIAFANLSRLAWLD